MGTGSGQIHAKGLAGFAAPTVLPGTLGVERMDRDLWASWPCGSRGSR